jgi:abhydrolase domain-containing protein 8
MQQFVHQIRYFWKEGYEIVAYDALGCGESAKPVGANLYSSEEMYRDFEAVVRHFTCDRSRVACAVIGHSFGGALVSKLSASMDAPKLTRCAVSICQPVDDGSFKKQSSIFKLPISVLWLIRPLLGIKARSLLLGPKATPALYEQEKEASARNPVHMFKSFYMGIAPGFLRIANFEPNRVPLLLLAGDVDKICPLERIRKLKDHLGSPQVRLEQVQNCGHQCMQEDPEQVNGMIEKFLQ